MKAYSGTIARHLFPMDRRRCRESGGLEESLLDLRPGPERIAEGRRELDTLLDVRQRLPEIGRGALLIRALAGRGEGESAPRAADSRGGRRGVSFADGQ